MAVVSVEQALGESTGSHYRGGKREYTVHYNAKVSSPNDNAAIILAEFATDPTLPYIGSSFVFGGDFDTLAFCDRITPNRKPSSQYEWDVVLNYTALENQQQDENGQPIQDPLGRRREFSFEMSPRQLPIYESRFGGVYYRDPSTNGKMPVTPSRGFYFDKNAGEFVPVCNSAADLMDPAPIWEVSDLVMRTTTWKDSYDAAEAFSLQDSINNAHVQLDLSGTIYNFVLQCRKGTLRCTAVNATFRSETYQIAGGATAYRNYWQYDYEFIWRQGKLFAGGDELGWSEWYPDIGYNQLVDGPGDPTTDNQKRILDEDGVPTSEPTNLDGNGRPTPNFLLPTRFIEFTNFNEYDFTQLTDVGFTSWTP